MHNLYAPVMETKMNPAGSVELIPYNMAAITSPLMGPLHKEAQKICSGYLLNK